ncbi:MAG: hypothetical protein ACNA8W_23240 [Bradymonadaceae bacterium]
MGIKIRSTSGSPNARKKRRAQSKHQDDGQDCITVGKGDFAIMTIPRDGGPTIVHRFKTRAEAEVQHRRNISEDKPLVGFDEYD